MRALILSVCVAGAVLGSWSPVAARQGVLRPAPAVDLPDEHGAVQSLAALRGQVVLVDMWASWCPPCKAAFPQYDALFKEFRSRGFQVLAINVDEQRADALRFLQSRPHEMTVVFDPKGVVPRRFKVQGMPTSYLVDREGNIRFQHEGFVEKDLREYRAEIEKLLGAVPGPK